MEFLFALGGQSWMVDGQKNSIHWVLFPWQTLVVNPIVMFMTYQLETILTLVRLVFFLKIWNLK
jgi:hypothetical protein